MLLHSFYRIGDESTTTTMTQGFGHIKIQVNTKQEIQKKRHFGNSMTSLKVEADSMAKVPSREAGGLRQYHPPKGSEEGAGTGGFTLLTTRRSETPHKGGAAVHSFSPIQGNTYPSRLPNPLK